MVHALWIALALAILLISVVSAEVVQLTTGPGEDTEAAWSPDGTKIVFQSARDGHAGIHILDLATGQTTVLVGPPGQSLFPAWSPDGAEVAFIHANITRTAVQGIDQGYNLFTIPATGGEPRRLTEGVVREFTPCYSQDGQTIYFSSSRELEDASIGVWRIPQSGGTPELVVGEKATDVGYMQPTLSPDGQHFACGLLPGFRANWRLRVAKVTAPERFFMLTDGLTPMYGPRWSPDGSMIACTGYRSGDPGWGIYLFELKQGGIARLDTGPGNSRSPAWSPDSSQLVFENNRSGAYKLYRTDIPELEFQAPVVPVHDELAPVMRFSFAEEPGETVPDLTGNGNDGKLSGDLPWADGALTMGSGGYLNMENPKGFDFGPASFTVSATVEIAPHTGKLRILAVGDYPEHRHGWQMMLSEDDRFYFNSRTPSGDWTAAATAGPAPTGRKIQIVGIRRRSGSVELYIDGQRQPLIGSAATFSYKQPTQVRLGTLYDGRWPFAGRLYEFAVWRGALDVGDEWVGTLEEFLSR